MQMTSRERVRAALAHQQPDRVPVDFGAHRSSGIMAIAYRKLRQPKTCLFNLSAVGYIPATWPSKARMGISG
jgi:uroporphyrinogen-III decarboxylase